MITRRLGRHLSTAYRSLDRWQRTFKESGHLRPGRPTEITPLEVVLSWVLHRMKHFRSIQDNSKER